VTETEKLLGGMQAMDGGRLTVGVIPTVLPYSMAAPLAEFRERYPRLGLAVREATTDRLIEGRRAGQIDLPILALPIKQPEIVCSELFREPLLVAVPREHPFAGEAMLALPQLLGRNCCCGRVLPAGGCADDLQPGEGAVSAGI
jgi:LysR family hydrogen peroxide-inducible transcriptional activator